LTRFPGTHGQFLGALGYRRAALRGAAVDAILSDDAELNDRRALGPEPAAG
jgi:hypothetical protein